MKRTVLFLSVLLFAITSHAQADIFKKHGYNKEPLTLSKGKYKETFYNEDVMQVGTVLIDTRTDKVVQFLEIDTAQYAYRAEITSRFLTIDPMAEEYYNWSPYVYVKNNPLKYIDKDGRQPTWPVSPADYQRAAVSQKIQQTIKNNSSTIATNAAVGVAAMSDVNDATVLTTTLTRGGNAINIDGTPASGVDMGFAALGAIIPALSGSAVKDALKSLGKALGIFGDAAKSVKALDKVGDVATQAAKTEVKATQEAFTVTQDGVILPKGYQIPSNYVENANRKGSYGVIENGKFVEKLRIDAPTPAGSKGPNISHFHLNGSGKHLTDPDKLPK